MIMMNLTNTMKTEISVQQIYKTGRNQNGNKGLKMMKNFWIMEVLPFSKTGQKSGESDFPKAIDRMYADNNNLSVGDTLKSQSGKRTWKITGLVALSDYSCLFQNNNDSMFDSVKFGVSVVTPEEFDTLDQDKLQYNYSWIYDKQPKTEKEEKDVSEELMENIGEIVTLEAFVPRYLNQAITFTGDDMGSDKAMMIILLYIVIVIMAFVFGITISNTIRKGIRCDRHTQSFRLYQTGTDPALYGTSCPGYTGGSPDGKYPGIYSI